MSIRIPSDVFTMGKNAPEFFERIEVLAIYSIDSKVQTEVCRFRLNEGYTVDEIVKCGCIKEFIVLKRDLRNFTCIIKGEFPREIKKLIRTFDIKFEFPIIMEKGFSFISIIGTSSELQAIIAVFNEKGWNVEILTIEDYDPHISGIFNILTDKQRDILIESFNNGYFDQPRRINAGELAEKMGMHKTTFLEHIHKAERRLISHLISHSA